MRTIAFAVLSLIALSQTAAARGKITSIAFDNFCDSYDINTHRSGEVGLIGTGCIEGRVGVGVIGNLKEFGSSITFSLLPGGPSKPKSQIWIIQYPLVTGGSYWYLFSNGKEVNRGGGTYTVTGNY